MWLTIYGQFEVTDVWEHFRGNKHFQGQIKNLKTVEMEGLYGGPFFWI